GSLTKMLDGRSETDAQRSRGEDDYARALERIARAAADLDSFWARYSAGCVTSAAAVGDHPWFAAYQPNGVRLRTSTTVDCNAWREAVKERAGDIRTEMDRAGEAGRRRGVYPGTTRDLRRRYKMTWGGWDR